MNNAMIEFRHVSKTFSRKGHPILALQDINLSIDRGDIFGIIGYSGAGKSTLLRLINRLETPGEGEVVLNGEPLQDCSGQRLQAIKKDIGMIFQNFNLLNSKTVFHNIAIPLILQGRDKAFIQARVAELLAFVDLSDKMHSYPNELSGGQKQRVGIARALATNPSVLLCDEATSALDPHTTVQILLLLQEINRRYGITIVLITHEMSVIQKICHKVAVMQAGRIVEQGTVFDLFAQPQHPVTASFVQSVVHDRLPQRVASLLQRDNGARANVLRSLPFIILLIVILPFTRLLVGTTIGTAGAIVPLIVFVAPYIARLVESSLLEVDEGILEAADAMGATPLQTVWHFMLPEAAASLILALTTATIGLLGATAMAGTVGGGGIGDLAITYGYQRFDAFATLTTALVLIVIVQLIQTLGTRLARRLRRE